MADHFCNGLKLTAPTTSQCGRTFSRWLVEYLVQICGWTVHDAVAGNWTNYVDSGAGGSVDGSNSALFSIGASAFDFTSTDLGAYLTLTGFSARFASRNGIYRIRRIVTTKIVELEVEQCMHEDGLPVGETGISWKLWRPTASYVPISTNVIVLKGTGTYGGGYNFHLHINVRATNSYFPELIMSPFGSWDSGSHAWLDSKRTSTKGIDNYSASLTNTDTIRVWSAGDTDRLVFMFRVEDDAYAWHFGYIGEIDVSDSTVDPKPCILWTGSNAGNATVGDDLNTLFGTPPAGTAYNGGHWLGYDDVTTVVGYATFAHCASSSDTNWMSDTQRMWQQPSRRRIRQAIVCECRTSGYMELRGTLRRAWLTARDMPRLIHYGTNGEYLHIIGGLTIPWFNSKVWYERG